MVVGGQLIKGNSMLIPNQLAPVVSVMALLGVVISGSVLAEQGVASDCLHCHVMNASADVNDPSKIYSENKAHHPAEVRYPQDATDFNPTNAQSNGMSFFDANHNGQADIDEVRIYTIADVPTVTCSSCHREHEQSLVKKSGNGYLRKSMEASELCVACHRK